MHFFFSVPRGAIDTGALVVCTLFFFQAGIYFEVRMDTVPIAICKRFIEKMSLGKIIMIASRDILKHVFQEKIGVPFG